MKRVITLGEIDLVGFECVACAATRCGLGFPFAVPRGETDGYRRYAAWSRALGWALFHANRHSGFRRQIMRHLPRPKGLMMQAAEGAGQAETAQAQAQS